MLAASPALAWDNSVCVTEQLAGDIREEIYATYRTQSPSAAIRSALQSAREVCISRYDWNERQADLGVEIGVMETFYSELLSRSPFNADQLAIIDRIYGQIDRATIDRWINHGMVGNDGARLATPIMQAGVPLNTENIIFVVEYLKIKELLLRKRNEFTLAGVP